MRHSEYLFVTVFQFLFMPTVFAPCVQICSTAWRHASFVVTACLPYTRAVESGMVHLNDLRPIFLRFRGLKIVKIGHNWRVRKIGTKPYAGYTAVSYLERIHCYREKSPLLAPSGIGSMGTFTTQDILTFLYWLQNRLGFCWTYALAAKVSFPCIRFVGLMLSSCRSELV